MQVMLQAGAHVKEEVCRALIVLISNAPELHGYAARSMYQGLRTSVDQAELPLSLVTCTCWFLGQLCLLCLCPPLQGHCFEACKEPMPALTLFVTA